MPKTRTYYVLLKQGRRHTIAAADVRVVGQEGQAVYILRDSDGELVSTDPVANVAQIIDIEQLKHEDDAA